MRKVAGFASVVMLLFATIGECPCQVPGSATTTAKVQEIRLGEMARGGERESLPPAKASRDGRHLAWVVAAGKRLAVAVDSEAGPPFDEIRAISKGLGARGPHGCAEFSDDGEHIAYIGRWGKTWHAVIDGEVGPAYDEVWLQEDRVFGRGGLHYAYVARRGDKYRTIIDGQQGPPYDDIAMPTLSPDRSRVAYVGTNAGEGDVVVLAGQPVGQAEKINPYSLTFSPDGRRFAYAMKRPEKAVIVDGETYPLVGETALSHPIFSPDSQHFLYVDYTESADGPDECWLVLDGEPGRRYCSIGMPCFVPGSGQVCYAARKSEWHDEVMVIGEEESPTYDEIHLGPSSLPFGGWEFGPAMQFSADGKRSAYSATLADEEFVVVDGRRGPAFRTVDVPVLSPNGRSLAYWAEVKEDEWTVIVDGRPGKRWDWFYDRPVFSPDGRRLAYVGVRSAGPRASQTIVVVDGKETPPWEGPSVPFVIPFFSPDSKHYACLVDSEDAYSMVLDGEEGPKYDWIHAGGWPWALRVPFQPDGSLEYFAERGDTIYRVRQFPPNRAE